MASITTSGLESMATWLLATSATNVCAKKPPRPTEFWERSELHFYCKALCIRHEHLGRLGRGTLAATSV
jgi:hypothetical protein